ncbi:MAG TPA: phytanoyl-CoA dioxygenase family protein [Polyangia bacterium]|nr:phytanoyl-CoA dioxygenase family protein [Polyangia bacterium]
MQLDETQRRALRDDGYLLVPGLIPRARVDAALKAINHSLGEEGIAKEKIWKLRSQTYCPELVAEPEILDLYRATPLVALAEAAIGPGRVVAPRSGQIALRFPQDVAEPKLPHPHIDGIPSKLNGVPRGKLHHFTALAGVFLNDVTAPFHGNFTVWPGSHRALEAHFRAHGTYQIIREFPSLEMPARQLQAQAGDALLAHYQLAHNAALNVGPNVRYAVFFRLAHSAHDPTSTATLTDLWREWEGVRDAPAP